jgi:hypothetical protein
MNLTVWPNTAQYKRALRRPELAFHDPELKQIRLDRDMMGMPASVEGQSAVVFFGRIGESRITVRCLKRPVAYGERRYSALSEYLTSRRTAPLAEVRWQSNGVAVDGRPWPIVRMEQVAGVSLRQYIAKALDDGARLQALSLRWRDLCEELRRHEVAHGDLQQDNVRVLDGDPLRLIDLDGVWAPPLAAMAPREYGHRHFQHPERLRTGHWDSTVDAFSALVIYVSVRALAADPTLWAQYHNDENLVLVDTDFEHPGSTSIWSRLAASRDLEVRDLVPLLEQFCKQTVRIETDLPTILRTRTLPGGVAYVVSGTLLQRATWWADPAEQSEAVAAGAAWTATGGLHGMATEAGWLPSQQSALDSELTQIVDRWPHQPPAPEVFHAAPPVWAANVGSRPGSGRSPAARAGITVAIVVVVLIVLAILIGLGA